MAGWRSLAGDRWNTAPPGSKAKATDTGRPVFLFVYLATGALARPERSFAAP
ncbi:MAG: hypothetical protein ABSC15_20605 [Terriglobales bacterium]